MVYIRWDVEIRWQSIKVYGNGVLRVSARVWKWMKRRNSHSFRVLCFPFGSEMVAVHSREGVIIIFELPTRLPVIMPSLGTPHSKFHPSLLTLEWKNGGGSFFRSRWTIMPRGVCVGVVYLWLNFMTINESVNYYEHWAHQRVNMFLCWLPRCCEHKYSRTYVEGEMKIVAPTSNQIIEKVKNKQRIFTLH